jgi:hypothetical protein
MLSITNNNNESKNSLASGRMLNFLIKELLTRGSPFTARHYSDDSLLDVTYFLLSVEFFPPNYFI